MADNLGNTAMVYRTATTDGISGPLAGANKLWLPIWSGEVIHAYDEYNMFEGLVDSKTITSGVAMEFPITGTISLKAAWNAGEELEGGTNAASQTIAVKLDKRPMAAHFEIDNIDLMQTQWEFRSELARQAGLTLANARDKQIAAYIARAAAEDLSFNPLWDGDGTPALTLAANDPRALPAGPVFLNGLFFDLGRAGAASEDRTNAALAALQAIEDFFVYLQTINAPTDGVVLAVEPRAFQDIRALGVARSASTAATAVGYAVNMQPMFAGVAEAGGLGAPLTMGMNNLQDSLEYMGCMIIKSNHLPTVDYSATPIGEARYNLKFNEAGICGLLFQRGAVASLKLQGLKVDTVDDIRRNTVFTVASMMGGTGVLRPECAAVLVKPTSVNCVASTTETTQANFAAATPAANTNADLFKYGAAQTEVNKLSVPASYLAAAANGGTDAHKARHGLRCLFGSNFSRECLPTAATTATTGYPYS